MKTITLLGLCAVLALTGCATNSGQALRLLPDGKYTKLNATVTGKFSATKFTGESVVLKDGRYVSGRAHLQHSNVYVPLIDLDIEKEPDAPVPASVTPLIPAAAAK